MSKPLHFHFDNSYARLPEVLFAHCAPTPVANPSLLLLNGVLAAELGLDVQALSSKEGAAVLSGNVLPEGAEPIAQAYAGHQFGFPNMLGDGRAILLGEQITASGQRRDIQLKGGGRTPFSRGGDGRAALAPMLREYLISEAMQALGIATTRSLAVLGTGEPVYRESALPGAILVRTAASHLRVGTFQYAAGQDDKALLETLVDYALERHYPDLQGADNPALALLDAVMERQVELVVSWMRVGFIHGVMNTDNVTLSGETIDYGPCAFMDAYDPATVFSSIDHQGRYAYGNQPVIAQWNLARFAETLLPLIDKDKERAVALANHRIEDFAVRYQQQWLAMMRAKLGLFDEDPRDADLIAELLDWMQRRQADYTNTFRDLIGGALPASADGDDEFRDWHRRWLQRLARQQQTEVDCHDLMRRSNPAIIPRNHQVERALQAAAVGGDRKPIAALVEVLAAPYRDRADDDPYRQPPNADEEVRQTFCGT